MSDCLFIEEFYGVSLCLNSLVTNCEYERSLINSEICKNCKYYTDISLLREEIIKRQKEADYISARFELVKRLDKENETNE